MALTPFRWISMAAIGCMLVVLTVVSGAEKNLRRYEGFRRAPKDTAEERLGEIAGGWNRLSQDLAARYRFLQLVDSAKRVASRMPDTGSLRVFVSGGYDAKARIAIDNVIRTARAERGGDAVGVDLFVLSDTVHFIRGILRQGFFPEVHFELPSRPGDRCRVYVRTAFNPSQLGYSLTRGNAEQQLFGPCGFYAAFGEPGPLVRQWLMSGAWQYLLTGSWTVAPEPLRYPRSDRDIYKGVSPALDQLNPQAGGPECMKGDFATCERIASTFAPRRGRTQLASPEIAMSLGYPRYFRGGLGGFSGEMLSDAVQRLGRERFRQFWTSADSVPVAFEKATGQAWPAFIQQWMISRYGEIDAGPKMSAFAVASSVVILLLAIAWTLRMSVARTYV